jgi:oxygen-independent coproporphyrinogen III oxidase
MTRPLQVITPLGRCQAGPAAIETAAQLAVAPQAAGGDPCSAQVRSAYLHVPFCFHKCHYCDFYSIVDRQDRQEAFVARLIDELRAAAPRMQPPLETFFIGGGTPTLLRPELWRTLLEALRDEVPLATDGEFTVEANPETVTRELAAVLVCGGVNRVSIGAQSFHPTHLKTLERWHDPDNVAKSVAIFRDAGIENINLDLIFAIPGESIEDWLSDLETALSLRPTHLSCYGLMYEPGTAMTARLHAGRITPADEDLEADMYEATIGLLRARGYEQYEISNWALPGRACRHNVVYWRNGNWWPLGPGASGHMNGTRWKNVPRLTAYLEYGPLPPIMDVELPDADRTIGERLMLGLRMNEGLRWPEVQRWLVEGRADRAGAIEDAIERRLLMIDHDRLRLTPRGVMLANDVLADMI